MLEIPEALTIARQLNDTVAGKKIMSVTAAKSPHKFVWYYGDPQDYNSLLKDKRIDEAKGYGGMVEIKAGTAVILVGDGVGLRYHGRDAKRSEKHQLLIEFEGNCALSASVQMYGGIWCFSDGEFDNPYYLVSKTKPSPLSEDFDEEYFHELASNPEVQKLSVKALLATEQRIPGLGNGVLQDILWSARVHPKRKMNTLTDEDLWIIFRSIKTKLSEMTGLGGRDTEKDLFGDNGRYKTMMSKNNIGSPCSVCGESIQKENYLGGSIYYCPGCQKL